MIMQKLESLTKKEFVAHYVACTLRLVFVGMSNTGKSRRAKMIRDTLGFTMYSVDMAIARALNLKNVSEVGAWMKGPSSYWYRARERRYLVLEAEHTFVDSLWANITHTMNFVFDTTGSVAHLPEWIRKWLSDNALVVYLTLDESDMQMMIRRFFDVPKPVVWGNLWKRTANRSIKKVTRHSYLRLLGWRSLAYRDMSNIEIPARELFDKTASEVMDAIMACLPGEEPTDVPWKKTA